MSQQYSSPTNLYVPTSAEECVSLLHSILFLVGGGAAASRQGIRKRVLLTQLASTFPGKADEAVWDEVISGLERNGYLENINAALPNAQPMFRLVPGKVESGSPTAAASSAPTTHKSAAGSDKKRDKRMKRRFIMKAQAKPGKKKRNSVAKNKGKGAVKIRSQ